MYTYTPHNTQRLLIMKQIPSQFISDEEYNKLILIKLEKNWTWKTLILSVIPDNIEQIKESE